jgi:hypothetical protein
MRYLIVLAVLAISACGRAAAPACASPPAATPGTPVNCIGGAMTTDSSQYAPGGTVTIHQVATNVCSTPVGVGVACGAPPVQVSTPDGRLVWKTPQMGIVCPALARLLQPGESLSYSQAWPVAADTAAGVYQISSAPEYGTYWVAVCRP